MADAESIKKELAELREKILFPELMPSEAQPSVIYETNPDEKYKIWINRLGEVSPKEVYKTLSADTLDMHISLPYQSGNPWTYCDYLYDNNITVRAILNIPNSLKPLT